MLRGEAHLYITRVVVKNYRCLRTADVALNRELNILVGNNECGKSTLLEAINLALTGQLNGRPLAMELHPHIFNAGVVSDYISALKTKVAAAPPSVLIELYFADEDALAKLKGTNNTRNENVPGVSLSISFNEEYSAEYQTYTADPEAMRSLPIEYYAVHWRSFADNEITARTVPIKPSFIDASLIRNNAAANRYVVDIMKDSLTQPQRVNLALSYRMMKDRFLGDARVKEVNDALAAKKGEVSDKTLKVSLDASSRASWELGVMPHLDDVPLTLVGKGEQNSIKIKLALDSAADRHLILIEEAENHLSYSNLNTLIKHIADNRGHRQLIITTHSSFVLNKLGVEAVILFFRGRSITLKDLSTDTQAYFMRLPGHDTLRLILARHAILVEGPSDELIVQAAYKKKHGKMPLEAGVDVISVNALAFKRFLEVADLLGRPVTMVTDNDGSIEKLEKRYADFIGKEKIKILYDKDEAYPTLEPQLLKANGRAVIEKVIGKAFESDDELLAWMKANKADGALRFLHTAEAWTAPDYISAALD